MLCDHLEGWDGVGLGGRLRREGIICMGIADSLCYTAETNTPL